MTDHNQPEASAIQAEPPATGDAPMAVSEELNAGADQLLQELVEIVDNLVGMSVGITIYCNGMILSGDLISGHAYLEQLAETIRGGDGDETFREAVADVVMRSDTYRASLDGPAPHDDDVATGHIHLRDVTIHSAGASRRIQTSLWRGRLAHVAGWQLGVLLPVESHEQPETRTARRRRR